MPMASDVVLKKLCVKTYSPKTYKKLIGKWKHFDPFYNLKNSNKDAEATISLCHPNFIIKWLNDNVIHGFKHTAT